MLNQCFHGLTTIKEASWHLQAIAQMGKQGYDFQSTWLDFKAILPLRVCLEKQKSYTADGQTSMTLCGRKRLQPFSFKPRTISGLGSGLKATASNHKIQTYISIKPDHTVKKKGNDHFCKTSASCWAGCSCTARVSQLQTFLDVIFSFRFRMSSSFVYLTQKPKK